jgi:hypothetical protein
VRVCVCASVYLRACVYEAHAVLTACIAVEEEWVLELEVQLLCDWFCQVLHTQPVHDGEAMPRRCQSKGYTMENAHKSPVI